MRSRAVAVLAGAGATFAIGIEAVRHTSGVRRWRREFIEQAAFLVSVTLLPVILIAIRTWRLVFQPEALHDEHFEKKAVE